MSNASVESLYQTIASGCASLKSPSGWQACFVNYEEIARYASYQLYFLMPGENKVYAEVDDSVADAFHDLRRLMATQSGGEAWYTAVFKMTPDGKFHFEFNYDHLPAFDIVPSPDKWRDEFKQYPRPELQAHIQDWLDSDENDALHDEVVQRLADLQRA